MEKPKAKRKLIIAVLDKLKRYGTKYLFDEVVRYVLSKLDKFK